MARRLLYERGCRLFSGFMRAETPETAALKTRGAPYDILDSFTDYLIKQKYRPSSVVGYITGAKRFLRYMGIQILDEIFTDEVELPKVGTPMDIVPSREQIQWILKRCNLEHQAVYTAMVASLARPESLVNTRVHHIDFSQSPTRIFVPKEHSKEHNDWETFLTDEGTELLKESLGDAINDANAYAFTVHKDKTKPTDRTSLTSHFINLAIQLPANLPGPRQALISPPDAKQKRWKIHMYSLKKFGFSQAYGVVHDIARVWAGQKVYLATYMKYSEDERRNFYLKCMDALTIFPKAKVDLAGIEQMQSLQDRVQMLEQLLISQGQFVELENPEEAAQQLPTYLAKGWKIVLKTGKGGVLLRPPDSSGLGPAG